MKKILMSLALLCTMSQPLWAQCYSSGTPIIRPNNSTGGASAIQVYPIAPSYTTISPTTCTPVQSYYNCPTTGGAAGLPVEQPVVIPKKHWWQHDQIQYQPVYQTPTGGAVPITPINGQPILITPSGYATPVCPSTYPVIQQ